MKNLREWLILMMNYQMRYNYASVKQHRFLKYRIQMRAVAQAFECYSPVILRCATEHRLAPDIILGILAIEHINRGSIFGYIEHFLARVYPQFLLTKDCSIGIAQIKISTAQIVNQCAQKELLNMLLDNEQCINICARLVRHYCDQYQLDSLPSRELAFHIAYLYLTGKPTGPCFPCIQLYAGLLADALECRLFYRCFYI